MVVKVVGSVVVGNVVVVFEAVVTGAFVVGPRAVQVVVVALAKVVRVERGGLFGPI